MFNDPYNFLHKNIDSLDPFITPMISHNQIELESKSVIKTIQILLEKGVTVTHQV